MATTQAISRGIGAAALVALAGCYSGLGAGAAGASDGTAGGDDTAGSGAEGTGSEGGDESGAVPAGCDGGFDVGPTPLRRLTRREYANAVRDLLGVDADVSTLDPDEKLATFDSNLAAPVSPSIVLQYRALAEEVADAAIVDLGAIVPCDPAIVTGDGATECTSEFVAAFGRRAFRRPLAGDELAAYVQLAASGSDFTDGIRLAIGAMLQSVHFLYHLELAPADASSGIVALDDHQLAARLSFFLWGSIPDDTLLDAADAGELHDPTRLRAEAERMLQSEQAASAVKSFHLQWLGLDRKSALAKSADVYPAFDDALRDAMWAETERFVAHVVLEGDGRLTTLLTSSESFVDAPLAELYGVSVPTDHDPNEPIALDPSQRAGVLTQAAFLAAHAHNDSSGPVQRGVTVRRDMLCQPLPPPPNDVPDLPPIDPDVTTRERFEIHSSDPTCAACHAMIDGIGLAMENYDGIGAHRVQENGKPIDASGELLGTDVDGTFDGAVALAGKLAASRDVHDCVTTQWFRFAFGRGESSLDACTIDTLQADFDASDGDVRELMLAIVGSDAFRNHRIE